MSLDTQFVDSVETPRGDGTGRVHAALVDGDAASSARPFGTDGERWDDARRHNGGVYARIARTFASPGARELATMMLAPAFLGLVAALVVADAITTVVDAVVVGLLIFGGSGTATVVLSTLDGPTGARLRVVAAVGVLVVASAVVSALVAPTLDALVPTAVVLPVVALFVVLVAIEVGSARWSPLPRVRTLAAVVLVVFVLSAVATGRTSGVVLRVEPTAVAMTTLAASIGVAFAAAVALVRPWFAAHVSLARFRVGSGVALVLLAASLLGLVSDAAPLVALVAAGVFAVDR
jgi:hypothetical protein